MHAFAAAKVHGLDLKETEALVRGFVGTTWWKSYCAFRDTLKVPKPADVLDGVVAFKHDSLKPDVTFVLLGSCTALVLKESDKTVQKKRGEALWKILAGTLEDLPDLALVNALALAERAIALTNPHAAKVCAKVQDFKDKLAAIK
jgi:hypothetical protein